MKLVKSLLLGSAAGLMAVAGAQAADLPSRKAAPAEFVRVCSAYGAGFFFIPGTETCLRVGGRVRAEYLVAERVVNSEDAFGFRARGRLNLDARTATAFGTLRTFVRFEMTSDSGQYNGSVDQYNTSVNLDKAFIQFAGITAGKAQSFFDFYAADLNWGTLRGTDGENANVLAYTATFGGGFSATISLEDGASRRAPGPVNGGLGREYPDVVGVLRLDQSWGSAQIMGALHQVRNNAGGVFVGATDQMGYAIGGGVKINLPFLNPGSAFWLEGVYAKGALNYLNVGQTVSVSSFATFNVRDNYATPVGGSRLTDAFSVTAGLLAYWTPQIRQGIFGSYLFVNQGGFATPGFRGDITEWRIGTNLIWSPVAGLDIGVEVLYADVERSRLAPGGLKVSDDSWQARLRIQRDF